MAERRPQRPSRSSVRTARLPKSRNGPDRQHRISRAQREAKRQRLLYIGIGAVVALLAAILIGTFVWTDVVRPRQVLASVNGNDISREDYWHARGINLVDQVDQYSYLAGVVGGDQAAQYQNAAANAQTELDDLWGSTDVDETYLQSMVDDQLFVQYADSLDITITDEQVDTFILNRFAPEDASLLTPTVAPTLVPERAAWATQTAVVTGSEPTPTANSALATPDPAGAAGTAAAPPLIRGGTPAAPEPLAPLPADALGSPVAGVPESAAATPAVSPTPDAVQALATAESGYDLYRDRAFEAANIDEEQYRAWVAIPALARQEVTATLEAQLGQSAPQVHGAHILVATQELADQIAAQLNTGANFEEIARSQSIDTVTAPNGGDLGWYSQYDVEPAFWSATSVLAPGQTSAPFQTPAGWEIVRVTETSPDRAFTDAQITGARTAAAEEWLAARAAEADISGGLDATATPGTTEFEPPVNAPTGVAVPAGTPPSATMESPESIGGTPAAGLPIVPQVVGTPAA